MSHSLLRHLLRFSPSALILFAMPISPHYNLQNYGFGGGGTSGATSSHYAANGAVGDSEAATGSAGTHAWLFGFIQAKQAQVPGAPTVDNGSGAYYNKLHVVINQSGNASDATYLVAISSDNFTTTNYVHTDGTASTVKVSSDYQTYAALGGSSGFFITGLVPTTTYKIKVGAMQGAYSETGFGPSANQTTATPSFVFDVQTDTQPSPPFTLSFGQLTAGSVTDSPQHVSASFTTNGASGASVYVRDQNAGLTSAHANYTVASATADLAGVNEGFGLQSSSNGQSAGGPVVVSAPYNGSGQNVGALSTSFRQLCSSSGPITDGSDLFLLKAKTSTLTPAGGDYADTVTVIGVANF